MFGSVIVNQWCVCVRSDGPYTHTHTCITPLIDPEKAYLPPLHLKLGLIKNFVKAVDQNSAGFMYEGWNFNSGNYLFTTDTK